MLAGIERLDEMMVVKKAAKSKDAKPTEDQPVNVSPRDSRHGKPWPPKK
jgi:hypothetical protein